jgi:hypothetical protein
MLLLLFLLIIAPVAFIAFYRRASLIGEGRRFFWGASGMSAASGPLVLGAILQSLLGQLLGPLSDGLKMVLGIFVVLCIFAGVLLAKWMLDNFLPLPPSLLREEESDVPPDI